jgi:pilus assembly protein CpaB
MNRNLLATSGALVVGGLFLFFGVYTVQFLASPETGGAPIQIIVALEDIPLGEPVRAEWITTRDLPQSYVEDRHMLAADMRELIGLPLAQSVHAGEAILRTDLSPLSDMRRTLSGTIPAGQRAMTIQAFQTALFGGLLRPGDHVDVLVSVGDPAIPNMGRTAVVLENVMVLAVGQEVHVDGPDQPQTVAEAQDRQVRMGQASNVTLRVSMEQSGLLAQARQQGAVFLVLRSPGDETVSTAGYPDVGPPDITDATRRWHFQNTGPRTLLPPLPVLPDMTAEDLAVPAETAAVSPTAAPTH